jgi:hypothetical protein
MNKYRIGTDVPFQLSVDDGVEYFNLAKCTILNVAMYCDAQEAFAGSCTWQLNADDHTRLDCVYPGDRQVYTGIMRAVVVMVGADGGKKAYDLADIFEIVATTEEANATGGTVTSATLSAWQLPMSTLSTIVEAAINATEAATESAIAEISYTASAEDDGYNVLHIEQEDGAAHNFNIKNGSRGSQGPQGETGPQGPQGLQGNTGSSVDYPFELVNNRTTDDATKALSAAEGKRLGDDISELEQKVDAVIDGTTIMSPNLFDKTAVTADKYINTNTGVATSSSTGWDSSDYIDISGVSEGSVYITGSSFSGSAGWACYDANKVYKHGGVTKLVAFQEGDVYVRFSVKATDIDTAMLTKGTSADVPGQYYPYGPISSYTLKDDTVGTAMIVDASVTTDKIADGAITSDKIAPGVIAISDGSITTDKLADDAVTKDKAEFIVKIQHGGTNLLNPATCVAGFIRSTDGVLRDTTTDRKATDFIPVTSDGIYQSGYNAYGTNGGWAVYNENKAYIRGGTDSPNSGYTYQAGDAYIRMTMTPGNIGVTSYVVKATDPHIYTPYEAPSTTYQLSEDIDISAGTHIPAYDPALSLAGTEGEKGEEDSLSNDTAYLSDYPQYLKRQFNLTLCGKITAFAGIDIGVGKDTYNGTFLRVDSTNIYLCRYSNGNVYAVYTQAHGLTIASFINVSAYMDDGILTAIVGTDGDVFKHSFTRLGNVDSYGLPFVTAPSGTTLTGFSFRSAGTEFRKPVWVIGDSYMSWYPQRWPFQLWDTLGIKSFLLDGLAGGGSQTMFAELQKMLNYGTPKFLLWCLGMNDDADAWSAVFSELSALCESKGITLIPQTIPWPEDNQSGAAQKALINSAIIASGDRYLDGYSAVSSDNNGTWYEGFTDDGVHPNITGAKAMATRFLADFPEFLQ